MALQYRIATLPRSSRRTGLAIATAIVLVLASAHAAAPVVVLQLHGDQQRLAPRIQAAAEDILAQYAEWFGAPPFERLILQTVPHQQPAPADQPGHVVVPTHWLQPERSLLMEADIARALARQWWGVSVRIDEPFLADGLAEYAQSRAVERLYDQRHQREAYTTYEARYFGGLLPWAIRALRLDRATAGVNRGAYRRVPDVDVRSAEPGLRAARAAKMATALITLERYIGWPALQRGLALAADRHRGRTMTAPDFARAMSDAADRDLSWFFDPLFQGPSRWGYAVESIATTPEPNIRCGDVPCVRSTVVVRRDGNTPFPGTSHQPVGDFESGRAIEVALEFASGEKVIERWDGRAETREFIFDAASPVVRATVDPRHVLMMDLRQANNRRSTEAEPTDPGLTSWAARWAIWLQDLLLTQAFLY